MIRTKTVKGLGIGNKFAYPTINLAIPDNFSYEYGVYSCFIYVDKEKFPGALFFGERKTFKKKGLSLEVFVIGEKIDNYLDKLKIGMEIRFQIGQKIRNVRKFRDFSSLKSQIAKDIDEIKKSLC